MDLTQLTPWQWTLALLCAFCVGLSKGGFGGLNLLAVALMAAIMRGHERESTGLLLPLLICGDFCAVGAFRKDVHWRLLLWMLLPAMAGVALGWLWIRHLSNAGFKPLIGWLVLGLAGLHVLQQFRVATPERPHSRPLAWLAGTGAGVTTMLANAAGPVMAIYFLLLQLDKMVLVSTNAWFFLFVNLWKVPFSWHLGLISNGSLAFNLMLAPVVFLGVWGGRKLLHQINQTWFERLLLGLTALTALHLIFG